MLKQNRAIFDALLKAYNRAEYLDSDPLRYVYRYTNPEDQEIVALLGALFAYGRVTAIFSFLDSLLAMLGPHPADSLREKRYRLQHHYYRFQTEKDIARFLNTLSEWMQNRSFPVFERPVVTDIYEAIDSLIEDLHGSVPPTARTRGWNFLIGRPEASAAKRWCLFFRWMVRRESPDTGLYSRMHPARLIYPLDTHIINIARWRRLTSRKTIDRRTAREITAAFQHLSPDDPLKYDFALTRPGILNDGRALSMLRSSVE